MFQVDGIEYFSASEIAEKIGATYRTVLDAIEKLSLPAQANIRDMRQKGYPSSDIPLIRDTIIDSAKSA